jgi:hypothetical protein
VPAQARAFDAGRILAHAGQCGELAEFVARRGIVGEQLCTRSNSASASARVLPFTASVMSEADAVEMAQPWPSKRMSDGARRPFSGAR